MKVLLITPGITKVFNDNAFCYSYMSKKGINICAISNRSSSTKGSSKLKRYEVMDGVKIHRVYENYKMQKSFPLKKFQKVKDIAASFKPDVILCSQQRNIHLALKLKREFGIPIVLLVEFAYDKVNPFRLIGKERLIKNNRFGSIIANSYWKWLCKKSDAVITCNPNDKDNMKELRKYNKNVFYVGWPSFPIYNVPENIQKRERGIFIGALTDHKNIIEFKETLPKIFSNTKIKQFYIIGGGKYLNIVEELKKRYENQLIHIPNVERSDALKLISTSYFAYAPAKYGAWGFIEDCWAMKTPIIVTVNHYRFKNKKDSIVCDKRMIDEAVNALCDNDNIYKKIQKCGYKRFTNDHHAYRVGDKYISILKEALYR